jgi:uncharacterized surface protein with fasciclin (FAS1) repeats
MYRISALTAAAVIAICAFANSPTKAAEPQDIVDTAVAAGSFKTLAAALQAADLVEALKGEGPFTVFAPTDDAFANLPEGTVETLLLPENKDQLTAVLTYHVVAGRVPAEQVVGLRGAKTLNGQRVDISVADGSVSVDKAKVLKTDILCSNGIIHVIDNVILPASDNLVATADNAGTFKTLIAAAEAAGLVGALSGEGPLTVFAPTDEAFAKLPPGTIATLLRPQSKDQLAEILKYHVVSGRVYSEDALAAERAETLQGSEVEIRATGSGAKVNNATLIATDVDASNGVIHIIDRVLLPGEGRSVDAAEGCQMIKDAVSRGAPMFNAGHHGECAQLYMDTMREMVQYGGEMPEHLITNLKQVMTRAEHTSCPTQRAWTLRHGLDHAYLQMARLQ